MLRADDIICGTSTTGTGTLTLAATPVPTGGTDPDAWLKSTGYNFVSANAILVSYIIKEYTNSNFTSVSQSEKGVGTLTLGASISAATLARTTVQWSATAEGTQPAVPTYASPSAINIGTAANVLVFIGPSSCDTIAFPPYADSTSTNASGWVGPPQVVGNLGGTNDADGVFNATLTDFYLPFYWTTPMLVKRFVIEVRTATTGTTNAYARIYAVSSAGQPGKLLIDFGVLGTAGSSLNSANTMIQSAAHASGFYLSPGVYILNVLGSFSSGAPTAYGTLFGSLIPPVFSTDFFLNEAHALPNFGFALATGGTAGAAPDPANLTGIIVHTFTGARALSFAMKSS